MLDTTAATFRSRFGLLIVLFCASGAAWQDTASIGGLITRTNGDPLSGVRVELRGLRNRSAYSEATGRFPITNLVAGDYTVLVQRDGYDLKGLRPLILADEIVRGGAVTLKAGESIRDFNIEMGGTGTVSGRVTGRNGLPISALNVYAMRRTYQDGRPRPIQGRLLSAGSRSLRYFRCSDRFG